MFNFDYGKTDKFIRYSYIENPVQDKIPFYRKNCGEFNCDSDYFTERDNHFDYLIIYTLSGCGKVVHKGNTVYTKANSLVLIDCKEYQYYGTNSSEQNWNFIWMHFNGTAARLYCDLIHEKGFQLVEDNHSNGILLLFKKLMTSKEDIFDDSYEHYLSITIYRIILLIKKQLDNNNEQYSLRDQQEILLKAICFIKENFRTKVSISDLAKTCNLSKFYFIKLFKSYFGKTPYEYLIHYRINYSKGLLITTDLDLYNIANQCGYIDAKAYITSFKKIVELTPNDYRITNKI